MNNKQDKVLVALNTGPQPSPADRWTTWARSLTARHERFTARQGFLIMTLVEPLRMFVSINQRLESFAFAVFPKLQVSIGPILKELGHPQFSSLPVGSSLSFPRVTVLENKMIPDAFLTSKRYQRGSGYLSPSMSLATTQFGATPDHFRHEETTHSSVHGAREPVVLNEARIQAFNISQSPVRRVFARFEERAPGVVLRKLLFENESQKVLQRVSRAHLRVEQRTRDDMVIRTQTKPVAAVEDRRRELEAQFAATAKTRGPSWPEKPPEINVEQLTEQVIRRIDHRITAYRERLGRAF